MSLELLGGIRAAYNLGPSEEVTRNFSSLLESEPFRCHNILTGVVEGLFEKELAERKFALIEHLMRHGASVTPSLLATAIKSGKDDCLKLLLRNSTDDIKRHHRAMHIIAANRNPNAKLYCELLIKYNFDINVPRRERLPIETAVLVKNIDVVETLLFNGARVRSYTLQLAFRTSLPVTSLERLVKFAALQRDGKGEEEFLQNFHGGRARPFMKFAKSCVAEVKILKDISLNSKNVTLFDFIISQKVALKQLLDDSEISNGLFSILSSTSLPIYEVEILRKLDRSYLINGFHITGWKCSINCEDKKILLNPDCFANICCFLNDEDITSLWIATKKIEYVA